MIDHDSLVEGQGSDFCHICTRRAPWVIGGGYCHQLDAVSCVAGRRNCLSLTISHLDLNTTITFCDILYTPDNF